MEVSVVCVGWSMRDDFHYEIKPFVVEASNVNKTSKHIFLYGSSHKWKNENAKKTKEERNEGNFSNGQAVHV